MSDRAAMILAVIFGLMVIFAILSKLKMKKAPDGLMAKAFLKLFNMFMAVGVLGFIYIFFAVERVTIFSSRIILIILGLTFLIWGGFIAKYIFIDIPKKRSNIKKRKEFQRYIP